MKKKILVFFCFFVLIISSFADDETSISLFSGEKRDRVEKVLSEVFAKESVKALLEKNKILEYKYNESDMSSQLAPKLGIVKKIQTAISPKGFEPVFLMEGVYIFPRDNSEKSDNVDIARILKSISKLEGLEYYSHSREEMRTLYVESAAVKKIKPASSGESEYQIILDPVDEPTDGLSVLACQKDLTFGRYIYRYDYFADDSAVATVCSNTQTLKWGIFNIISAENLKVALVVKEYKDFVLVYCITKAKFLRLPGLKKKMKNSFSSRAEAMYNWFVDEYKKANKSEG